jgi:hypothetical protein
MLSKLLPKFFPILYGGSHIITVADAVGNVFKPTTPQMFVILFKYVLLLFKEIC